MIVLVALLALLAVPVSAAPPGMHAANCAKQPKGQPFSLVLATKTPTVTMGSTPEFDVTITNCSGKTLNITAGFPQFGPLDTSYSLDITDPEGNRVAPGLYHVFNFKAGEVETGTIVEFRMLPAGHAYTEPAYNLSWRYKFDEAGKYRIQVSRKLPNKAGVMVLKKSNVITITVTK